MNQLKWIQRTKVRIPLNNQSNDILLICNVLFSTGFSRNALWFKKGRTLLIVSNSAIHMGMYPNLHLTIFLFLGNHRTILEERNSCQKHFIFSTLQIFQETRDNSLLRWIMTVETLMGYWQNVTSGKIWVSASNIVDKCSTFVTKLASTVVSIIILPLDHY